MRTVRKKHSHRGANLVQHWPGIRGRGLAGGTSWPLIGPLPEGRVRKGSCMRGGGSVSHCTCTAGRRRVGSFHWCTGQGWAQTSTSWTFSQVWRGKYETPSGEVLTGKTDMGSHLGGEGRISDTLQTFTTFLIFKWRSKNTTTEGTPQQKKLIMKEAVKPTASPLVPHEGSMCSH